MNDSNDGKKDLSRRGLFGTMAAGAAAATALPLIARAQPATPAAGRGGAPAAGRGGRGPVDIADDSAPLNHYGAGDPIPSDSLDGQPTQGGSGPIRVLFISSYHPFDRQNLFLMLDSFGREITWCHIEHPAAEHFFDPAIAEDFDVYLFYDAFAGRNARVNGAPPPTPYAVPSPRLQANLKQLLTNGNKAFVMLHHALASWCHTWPAGVNGSNAYVEMMGGAADWGSPLNNLRGVNYPASGYRQGTEQRITVVDRNHPITAGVDDFDIVDEAYLCPMFEDSVHPLLRSSFHPTVDKFDDAPSGAHCGPGHPPGSNMTGWVKTAENTPIVYIQHGHDNNAWSHPHYRRLVLNAIRWGASPDAKTWAKANSKRIFV